ncbi:RNA degradosome polyphosphate kinase [Globicatella sp. HMSC072A10]|uniref:RNA degradosome polyphosphate kinase n=1 Tax=Globicatella sp. HMSC072A10 TaxID=1739315 RepID=UPI000A00E9C8|nr:RNA degradosome polyphosphate kinase [Globicatella sp. HMSC072A10]
MPKRQKKSEKIQKHSFKKNDFIVKDPYDSPDYYFNRELSWLDFNKRVIEEAYDQNNPFLEQLNFLAIASSNADEFFMIRVAGVYDQYSANVEIAENKTQMTPFELLQAIRKKNAKNIELQYNRYHELVKILPTYDYQIKRSAELTPEELVIAEHRFRQLILPTLSPIGIDAYRPFPHLSNKAINILVSLQNEKGNQMTAIVPIPNLVDRYITIENTSTKTLVFTEDLIVHFIDELFKGYHVNFSLPFRITRDADFDIREEGALDLIIEIEDSLKKRKNGEAVRIEVDTSISKVYESHHLDVLMDILQLEDFDLYQIAGPLDLTFLFKLHDQVGVDHPEALYPPFEPFLNPEHTGEKLFDAIREKDLFFNHPYDSFKPIVSLIETAANDEKTIAIKQTLYRVSKHSPIIAALKQAAERGKEVTVLVELKARFDEENNVFWARELEEAGCHVLYGVSELKTHSKITLVIRREEDKIQRYVHLGTGNYNDKTARIYTDMGILTCHEEITEDASKFFNHLSGFTERPHYKHLHVSPFEIRDSLIDYIDEEIAYQNQFGNGRIVAKMNSLTDKEIIKKFYQASQAGVKIELIIRGICCLKPGVEGISENIHVRSIVGRFLEHSRIYFFNRNGAHHLFLSSADMMTRNMVRRVEIEFPILSTEIEKQIIEILDYQLADTMKARELQVDGTYTRPDRTIVQNNSQIQLMRLAESKREALVPAVAVVENKPILSWWQRFVAWFK